MAKGRIGKSQEPERERISVTQKVIIGACVIAAIAAVVYLALYSSPAKAGGGAFRIPAPDGTKFEVNGKVDLISQREGANVIVTVIDNDPQAKAKARWYYAGTNCQSSGTVSQVLSEIQRCANDAMRKK